jgi:hypothetical protein
LYLVVTQSERTIALFASAFASASHLIVVELEATHGRNPNPVLKWEPPFELTHT